MLRIFGTVRLAENPVPRDKVFSRILFEDDILSNLKL